MGQYIFYLFLRKTNNIELSANPEQEHGPLFTSSVTSLAMHNALEPFIS